MNWTQAGAVSDLEQVGPWAAAGICLFLMWF